MQEKKALTREISKRYQKAEKKEKTEILNELVKTTGYNRKYILHVLANWGKTSVVRHHCGTSDSGEFCLTLTATDVYSGWVELRPTLNKANKWVFQALLDIKSSIPFPLTGIDRDNGAEFINFALLKWCCDERIQFTRTRTYRKNDNCFVEQKNCTCVRNFVGYYRFSAAAECDALSAVYRSLCPLMNFFMPTI